ncbi:MAG: DUF3883 domain-containing protein [Sulfurovum sp.]|nr:DUF3883 domain-containing protein [Sulfurovum sp.]MCB4773361.1 DUF3883 domain-containing protein [Sulfurovum sp.]
MLEELKKYRNLGTPSYFWEFFCLFEKNKIWTESTIKEYFFNKRIDDRIIFDGCIPLLKATNIIFIDVDQTIQLEYPYRNILHSQEFLQQKLLEGFLDEFQEDEKFSSIFKNTSYDYLVSKSIVVDDSSFGLKYSNIRKLLVDFDFLRPYEGMEGKYIINPRKKKYFEEKIVPKIRKIMGIEELKKQLKQQELNGEEAEKYVLSYEKSRLNGKDGIEWIAPYDSAAGFDILSYHDQDDDENNRFIEVKSYIGIKPYFYWTKNEMKKAKDRGYDYVIYLVCRERMNDDTYHPIIIHNPFSNILESEEWSKEVDKYYIKSL